MPLFENYPVRPDLPPSDQSQEVPSTPEADEMLVPDEPLPASFVEDNEQELFEPDYMRGLTESERKKVLWGAFLTKMMDWFDSPDADPRLEAAIRQSETIKMMAQWTAEASVEEGIITAEHKAQKMRAIGVEDRL